MLNSSLIVLDSWLIVLNSSIIVVNHVRLWLLPSTVSCVALADATLRMINTATITHQYIPLVPRFQQGCYPTETKAPLAVPQALTGAACWYTLSMVGRICKIPTWPDCISRRRRNSSESWSNFGTVLATESHGARWSIGEHQTSWISWHRLAVGVNQMSNRKRIQFW